jgi:hypothetical protein
MTKFCFPAQGIGHKLLLNSNVIINFLQSNLISGHSLHFYRYSEVSNCINTASESNYNVVRGKTHLKLIIPGCFQKTSQNRTVLLQTEVLTTIPFSFTNKGTNQVISIVAFRQYKYSQRSSLCLSAVEISREYPKQCDPTSPNCRPPTQ